MNKPAAREPVAWVNLVAAAIDHMSLAFVSDGWAFACHNGAVTLTCRSCGKAFAVSAETKPQLVRHRARHERKILKKAAA